MTIIAPSLLAADFLHLEEEITRFNNSKAMWLHYDVMDGNFVPNISFGPDILKQVNKITDKFIDVHIMVQNPSDVIDYFSKCKVDMLTFHYEACKSDEERIEVINKIHSLNMKAGISIKPNTKPEVLDNLLDKLDLVLVMSVEPGFGGQKFMNEVMEKGDYLFQQKQMNGYSFLIEVDGGINFETSVIAKEHHFEVLVAGSYCFKHPEGIEKSIEYLL